MQASFDADTKRIHESFKYKVPSYNIAYNACPSNFKHPHFNTYLTLLDAYDKSILPDSGGMLDQSSKTIEVIQLLSNMRATYQEAQAKAQAKQSKPTR